MRLVRISPIVYHFSGGMSMNSKMHLILDFCEKILSRFCRSVIVKSCGIDVCDFLIEFPLRQPYLPDFFQLFLKIFLCQNGTAIFSAVTRP